MIIYRMAHVFFGVLSVNLCLLSKGLLSLEPPFTWFLLRPCITLCIADFLYQKMKMEPCLVAILGLSYIAINNLIVPGGYFVPSPFLVLKIYLCSYLQTLAASWLFNKLVGTGSMLSIFLWFVHPISKILYCPFSTGCSVYQHHTFHSFIDFVLSGSKTELLTRLHKGLSLLCPLKTKVRYSSKAT